MNSYIILNVKGRNVVNFLHKCRQNNINIIKIKNISHSELIITINEKDYNKLLKIKSIYKLKIINSTGLLKYEELINKNKILLIMAVIGIIFLILLSNIIFEVQIISDNNKLNQEIRKELYNYKIKKYNFKKSYEELQKIKENILNDYKDSIEWLEITQIGSKCEVKIVERKKNKIKENKEYTNVIAGKSGVIKKIYAYDGEKIVMPNTYVNKGDIIISGSIMKGEDIKKYVHASGKVYAEVWYDVQIEFPLKYQEKIYTKNKKKSIYININDKIIEKKRFKEFERKKIFSLENKLVPFSLGIEDQLEVKIINDKYSIKQAKIKAIEKAKEKILLSLDTNEYIINEKVLKFNQKDSKIILDMFFTCFEEIGKEEKIIINEEIK